MDQTSVLDFVKALSDPDRLRIIGALSQGPQTAGQIAARLGLPFRKAVSHLSFLSHVGLVLARAAARKQDEVYALDAVFLEKLARQQFEGKRPVYLPPDDAGEKARRVLAAHLNPDGTIRQIPLQHDKRHILLTYAINAFETGRTYTEKEVNTVLKRLFDQDSISLRRYLVDANLLAREPDGSRYWRPAQPAEGRPE